MSGGKKNPNRPQRRAKGRTRGLSAKTSRRGPLGRLARAIGTPDEVILSAIAPRLLPPRTMPERERQKQIRRTLNRWQKNWEVGAQAPDPKARQEASYALAELVRAS